MLQKEITVMLNMSNVTIKKLKAQGVDLDGICNVFKSPNLSIREKRDYLYSLNYNEFIKERIWEGYMGDIQTSIFKYRVRNNNGGNQI